MRLKRLRIGVETPIYFILLGMMAIQIASPLRITPIMSLGTWLIIIATLASFAISILARKISDRYLLLTIFLALFVLMSVVATFSFDYPYVVAAFSFLEIPFLLVSYPKCKKQNVHRAIYACFAILSIYYTIVSLSPLAYIYYTKYGATHVDFMTLGYNNPNETAMYLIVCFFVLVSWFGRSNNKIVKALVAIDILLLSRLIILTFSRTAILVLIVYVVLVLIYRKRQVSNIVRNIACVLPFLFLILTFAQNIFGVELYFMGEVVDTGRLDIYDDVLVKMDFLRFLFGDFGIRFQNLHNAFWSIFATIGMFGLSAFLAIIYTKIRDTHIRNNLVGKFESKAALIGLLCIVAYMATESAFMTAGGTFAAAFFSLYLLSVSEENEI